MVVISFVLAALYALTQVAGPVFLGQSITIVANGLIDVTKNGTEFPVKDLIVTLLLCALSFILNWFFYLLQDHVLIGVTQRMVLRLRMEISDKMAKLPLSYYESHLYGEILSTLTNDINSLSMNFSQGLDVSLVHLDP